MSTKEKAKSIQRVMPKLNRMTLRRVYKLIHANHEIMTQTKNNYLVNLTKCREETVDALYDLLFCADIE